MKSLLNVMLASFLSGMMVLLPADAKRANHKYLSHELAKHHAHHIRKSVHKHAKRKVYPKPVVVALIDVSSQTMSVSVNGAPYAFWRVSTARPGYHTPRGSFRAGRMAATYYSKKYDNSPMPHSVFFSGGNAIHGTTHLGSLGRPASHGCVRLAPANAKAFYSLVASYGQSRTRITVRD